MSAITPVYTNLMYFKDFGMPVFGMAITIFVALRITSATSKNIQRENEISKYHSKYLELSNKISTIFIKLNFSFSITKSYFESIHKLAEKHSSPLEKGETFIEFNKDLITNFFRCREKFYTERLELEKLRIELINLVYEEIHFFEKEGLRGEKNYQKIFNSWMKSANEELRQTSAFIDKLNEVKKSHPKSMTRVYKETTLYAFLKLFEEAKPPLETSGKILLLAIKDFSPDVDEPKDKDLIAKIEGPKDLALRRNKAEKERDYLKDMNKLMKDYKNLDSEVNLISDVLHPFYLKEETYNQIFKTIEKKDKAS